MVALLAALASSAVRAADTRADVPSLDERSPSFRAFWADAFSPGFKSTTEIDAMIARALTGRYNAIFAEVLAYHDRTGGGHGAYWNSGIVPKATDISGGINPLAYLVQQAHANGLEVHAWIVPYRACTTWPPSGNATLAGHPEWLMVPQANMGGGPVKIDGAYILDPGSPDVQEYLTSIIRELVTNYAIDGVNFDYIRYTQNDAGYPANTGYADSSLARFQRLTGYVGVPDPNEPTWEDFRRQTINELVRRTRAEIPAITSNPRQPLRFTADLICSGDAPGNFINSDAYHLYQDWQLWMAQGWLDAGVPMNYKREYNATQAQWYRHWINAAISWRYSRHMYCGQANYLNTKADSVTQLLYGLGAGADGSSNYSYYDTADEDKNGTPEHDMTWYTYVASHVFTTAVATPLMPWRYPSTATEGTLWGRIYDPATNAPIDGATVVVGAQPAEQTDGNGYYIVTLVPASPGGTASNITASHAGCPDAHVNGCVVLPGDIVRRDIPLCNSAPGAGDYDLDGNIDQADWSYFRFCFQGPGHAYGGNHICLRGDADGDGDIDLTDFANFQAAYTGP